MIEKSKLQINATKKNTAETTLILDVVRGCLNLTPIVFIKATARKTKLPILKMILFSLSLKL